MKKIDYCVEKFKEMETTIETLQKSLSDTVCLLHEQISYIEKRNEETHNNDVKIVTMERRIYILEKRRLGTDFCD